MNRLCTMLCKTINFTDFVCLTLAGPGLHSPIYHGKSQWQSQWSCPRNSTVTVFHKPFGILPDIGICKTFQFLNPQA